MIDNHVTQMLPSILHYKLNSLISIATTSIYLLTFTGPKCNSDDDNKLKYIKYICSQIVTVWERHFVDGRIKVVGNGKTPKNIKVITQQVQK